MEKGKFRDEAEKVFGEYFSIVNDAAKEIALSSAFSETMCMIYLTVNAKTFIGLDIPLKDAIRFAIEKVKLDIEFGRYMSHPNYDECLKLIEK